MPRPSPPRLHDPSRVPSASTYQGLAGSSVSHEMLDHLRVHAAPEQQGGAGVAKVVPAYVGQPARRSRGLKYLFTMF